MAYNNGKAYELEISRQKYIHRLISITLRDISFFMYLVTHNMLFNKENKSDLGRDFGGRSQTNRCIQLKKNLDRSAVVSCGSELILLPG